MMWLYVDHFINKIIHFMTKMQKKKEKKFQQRNQPLKSVVKHC